MLSTNSKNNVPVYPSIQGSLHAINIWMKTVIHQHHKKVVFLKCGKNTVNFKAYQKKRKVGHNPPAP